MASVIRPFELPDLPEDQYWHLHVSKDQTTVSLWSLDLDGDHHRIAGLNVNHTDIMSEPSYKAAVSKAAHRILTDLELKAQFSEWAREMSDHVTPS
jgi:hypothetical protein